MYRFDNELKFNFIDSIKKHREKNTVRLYEVMLAKIDDAEIINGCELKYFNEKQIDLFFITLNAKSKSSLNTYLSILKDYLTFTTDYDNTLMTGFNYVMQMSGNDLEQFINVVGIEMRYITPKELSEIISIPIGDALCKAITILLFHGIKGEVFSDILNIKTEDVDIENGIIYKGVDVLFNIPKEYLHIFKEAISGNKFIEWNVDGKIKRELELVDNGYLIRRNINPRRDFDFTAKPDKNLLNRRMLQYYESIGYPYLSVQSIYNSGIVYRMLEYNNFEQLDYRVIEEYLSLTGENISYNTAIGVSKVLLKKLKGETKVEIIK